MRYLSVYVKGAGLLVQVYVCDPGDFSGLLDVGPMSPNGQAHQVFPDGELFVETCRHLPGLLRSTDREQNECSLSLLLAATASSGNGYLQMSDGLLVTLNDEELAAEASEVHIVDHVGPLSRYLVDGLTGNDGVTIATNTRQACVSRSQTHQNDELVFLGVVGDAEGSDGLFILFMRRLVGTPADRRRR